MITIRKPRWLSTSKTNTTPAIEPINQIPVTNFRCLYCDENSKRHPKYYVDKEKFEQHIKNTHPEYWNRLLEPTTLSKHHNKGYTSKQLEEIKDAYLYIRATPDFGLKFVVTNSGVVWSDRSTLPVNEIEKETHTHVRGLNYAVKKSGRTSKAVRSVLNGVHGVGGQALMRHRFAGNRADDEFANEDWNNGQPIISRLTVEALAEVKDYRLQLQLTGNAGISQLANQLEPTTPLFTEDDSIPEAPVIDEEIDEEIEETVENWVDTDDRFTHSTVHTEDELVNLLDKFGQVLQEHRLMVKCNKLLDEEITSLNQKITELESEVKQLRSQPEPEAPNERGEVLNQIAANLLKQQEKLRNG